MLGEDPAPYCRLGRTPSRVVNPPPYHGLMARLADYCEAFNLATEQCFRLIHAEDRTGHAQHCPYITEWRGR